MLLTIAYFSTSQHLSTISTCQSLSLLVFCQYCSCQLLSKLVKTCQNLSPLVKTCQLWISALFRTYPYWLAVTKTLKASYCCLSWCQWGTWILYLQGLRILWVYFAFTVCNLRLSSGCLRMDDARLRASKLQSAECHRKANSKHGTEH